MFMLRKYIWFTRGSEPYMALCFVYMCNASIYKHGHFILYSRVVPVCIIIILHSVPLYGIMSYMFNVYT